ncbi:MAG: triose-phosphate isomerase [Spongiibacteraceae bacterium]
MRRKLIVGNWKMHGSKADIAELLTSLQQHLQGVSRAEIAVCPPYPYLLWVQDYLPDGIGLGAQNVCVETQGAFTGEVAASMLRDCDCRYVIVGHSERRQLYGESDELIARKTRQLLEHDLIPIVCVGETLTAREANQTLVVIGAQLDAVFAQVGTDQLARCVIAYEPVWAIGTGRTATPEQAQEVHAYIRGKIRSHCGSIAEDMQLLYGGSVKANNAATLFSQSDIDGGLIGGASLNAEEFAAICRAAE